MIEHPAFTIEEWKVRETPLQLDILAQTKSIFALSNGHIGLRGNLDDTNLLSVWQNNRPMGGKRASACRLWMLRIQRAYQLMNYTTEVPHRRSQHNGEG